MDRWKDAQTHRRTNGWTDGLTYGQTDRRTNGRPSGQTDGLIDRHTNRQTDRHTGWHTLKTSEIQMGRQFHKQILAETKLKSNLWYNNDNSEVGNSPSLKKKYLPFVTWSFFFFFASLQRQIYISTSLMVSANNLWFSYCIFKGPRD